ncbi:MAG: DUF5050 domain-containing protein [Lachnospirales bacterium]
MKFYKAVAFGLVVSALLSGCGKNVNIVTDTERDKMGNSTSNISNLGSVCSDDTNLYYQKADDGYNLYSSTLDGKNEKELNDAETYFINAYGDSLYYADAADGFSIYSMKKDGSDKKRIIEAPAYYVNVYNDKIYYVDFDNNQKIYSANLDGSDIKEICSDTSFYMNVYGNCIYYINLTDGAKIYSVNIDGSGRRLLVDDYCGYLAVYNDCIYYTLPLTEEAKSKQENSTVNENTVIGDDAIYRYSLIDGTIEKKVSEKCTDINVYNDRIYYRDIDKKCIYSCDLEGQDTRVEVKDDGVCINIAADRIFYVVKTKDGTAQLKSKEL